MYILAADDALAINVNNIESFEVRTITRKDEPMKYRVDALYKAHDPELYGQKGAYDFIEITEEYLNFEEAKKALSQIIYKINNRETKQN